MRFGAKKMPSQRPLSLLLPPLLLLANDFRNEIADARARTQHGCRKRRRRRKKTHFGRVLCLLLCLIFLLFSLWPKASQIYEPDWLPQHPPPPTPSPAASPAPCVPRYRSTRPRPHAWESDYLRRMRIFLPRLARVCLFPVLFGGHEA